MNNSELVYSTAGGSFCRICGKPLAGCVCRERAAGRIAAGDGIVRVGRSTKGRKGNGVTVVTGIPLSAERLADLARDLKKKCGCGGTVRDGVIEIQGDKRDLLVAELRSRGYTVKRSGG